MRDVGATAIALLHSANLSHFFGDRLNRLGRIQNFQDALFLRNNRASGLVVF